MEVITLGRKFIATINSQQITLDDPNPSLSPEQVLDFYSLIYPTLVTSNCAGPEIESDARVYTFNNVIGTKG